MGDKTGIQWTDASWNPVSGCSRVSDGCRNCYAETLSNRFGWTSKPWTHVNAAENVVLRPEKLDQPLRWKRPRKIFVNSMSDLFHEQVPDEFIAKVFGVMALTPRHIYQILTKRPERMRDWVRSYTDGLCIMELLDNCPPSMYQRVRDALARLSTKLTWPLPNVWLGVSVENQRAADERIPLLRETPAAVRFLSCEPLLEPVTILPHLIGYSHTKTLLDWVIIGGESGPKARPMEIRWADVLLAECEHASVPVFMKQLGTVVAHQLKLKDSHGGNMDEWPDDLKHLRIRDFPKTAEHVVR